MKLVETSLKGKYITEHTFYVGKFLLNGKPCEIRDNDDRSNTYLLYEDWYEHESYDNIKAYEVVE